MNIFRHQLFMESMGSRVKKEPGTPVRPVRPESTSSHVTTPVKSSNYLHYAVESSLKRRRKRLRSELKALDLQLSSESVSSSTFNDTAFDSPSSDTSDATFWTDAVFDKIQENYGTVAWTSPTRSLLV
ncbi:hypothetical protein B0I72DRAFT_161138 [Yarrowia lipolytica]|jgi:hypothetical protein|uniref:Uncharacterized protein n=1 Tax=Yarrowia lipolytica TaxID=4952 RepID=A0A371C0N6_YARLL|nr:hypothetical protein B0I71DRAFT_148618 [Yarrowia lipolytica]RDW29941.1 hypothetical protein B0I72DRAFT_161138 [Yarrowia lipolytica]RDW37543.1 hypothetical protein B0I73DRAFT_142761 [Yarrowia lipolytica]RDW43527.1 hypothetical protein B0I74DRAFT_131001 [Yarrowia lipolytica]RDW50637.1 hypothetical protein B0I75DRAFT_154133 [Yarrowia lipolytica]